MLVIRATVQVMRGWASAPSHPHLDTAGVALPSYGLHSLYSAPFNPRPDILPAQALATHYTPPGCTAPPVYAGLMPGSVQAVLPGDGIGLYNNYSQYPSPHVMQGGSAPGVNAGGALPYSSLCYSPTHRAADRSMCGAFHPGYSAPLPMQSPEATGLVPGMV